MKYYKATRPNGTDFRTGTVNYAAALDLGTILEHHAKALKDHPSTYFSVAITPTNCTGMTWPCRLFEVKPRSRVLTSTQFKTKRACSKLEVLSELPAHLVFGPQGQQVVSIIERVQTLTSKENNKLYVAYSGVSSAAYSAAYSAASNAAYNAAYNAANSAAYNAPYNAPYNAARAAILAYLTKDLITQEQFDTLAGSWTSVMGEPK